MGKSLRSCAVLTGLILLGCAPIQVLPPSVVVEARVSGLDGANRPAADVVVALRHDQSGGARLAYRPAIAIQDLREIRLTATDSTGFPFPEEWHLLQLSRSGQRPGTVPVIREFTADPGWIRRHTGQLAWLTLRKDDLSLPSEFFRGFPPASIRPGGAMVLARVPDAAATLPWISVDCPAVAVMPMTSTLLPPPADARDCFDMHSLTSMLLNHIAMAVTQAAADSGARARSHSMTIVPHVATPAVAGRPDVPGVGFVYQTVLEPVLGGTGVGPFTGTLTLSVPLTLMFGRIPPGGTLATSIDPLGPSFPAGSANNIDRITVFAEEGSISSVVAGRLRSGVHDAVVAVELPTGPAGVPLTSLLDLLLVATALEGRSGLPADFSVLAVPSDRTVAGAPDTIALRMGAIDVVDRGGATPPLPGGTDARTVVLDSAGRVRVLVNLDPTGTRVRSFALPAAVEVLAFDLLFLH